MLHSLQYDAVHIKLRSVPLASDPAFELVV